MDRNQDYEITPQQLQWLKRARASAIVIFTGFFVMFVLFAPEAERTASGRLPVDASLALHQAVVDELTA